MARIQLLAVLVLGGLSLANAKDISKCALHGAEAVDEMLDAAVFIWASVERCEQPGEAVRCEINVASAIESVNGMINVILKALDKCDQLKTAHHKCGMAAGVLTKSFAGLAAASGGIVAKCPNDLLPHPVNTVAGVLDRADKYGNSNFGPCVVNIKDSMTSLFKAIKRMMTVKHNCEDAHSKHCAHNSIKIVSAFVGLGEYLAGAVGHCSHVHQESSDAICAEYSLKLVKDVHDVSRAGINLAKYCEDDLSDNERLYLENEDDDDIAPTTTGGSMTLALAALLPISAVLSFAIGSRFARARSQPAPIRDFESLTEVMEE